MWGTFVEPGCGGRRKSFYQCYFFRYCHSNVHNNICRVTSSMEYHETICCRDSEEAVRYPMGKSLYNCLKPLCYCLDGVVKALDMLVEYSLKTRWSNCKRSRVSERKKCHGLSSSASCKDMIYIFQDQQDHQQIASVKRSFFGYNSVRNVSNKEVSKELPRDRL